MNKIDYEDVIYSVLSTKKSCGFNELHDSVYQVQKIYVRTFSKYLGRLVDKGLVIKEIPKGKKNKRPLYHINPDIKTRVINLTNILEDDMVSLKEELHILKAYTILLKKLSNEEFDNPKKITPIFSGMVIHISIIYKVLSFLEFVKTSGLVPDITRKRVRSLINSKMDELAELLNQIKKTSPLFHHDLCIYVATNVIPSLASNG